MPLSPHHQTSRLISTKNSAVEKGRDASTGRSRKVVVSSQRSNLSLAPGDSFNWPNSIQPLIEVTSILFTLFSRDSNLLMESVVTREAVPQRISLQSKDDGWVQACACAWVYRIQGPSSLDGAYCTAAPSGT